MVPQAQAYDGRFKAQFDPSPESLSNWILPRRTPFWSGLRAVRSWTLSTCAPVEEDEFLNMLGKFTAALDVVRKIERTTPMDKTMKNASPGGTGLDLTSPTRGESRRKRSKNDLENRKYQAALDVSVTGLKAIVTI